MQASNTPLLIKTYHSSAYVGGVETYPKENLSSIILKTSSLPYLQQPIAIKMSSRKNYAITMLGTMFAFTVLIGLTIAGVTSENKSNANRKSSDIEDEMFDNFDDESLSLVKRTAVPDAQRFRPRQRQLNNFNSGLKESFSLSDIVNNEYSAERWNGTWISDIEFAYRNRQGDLSILRYTYEIMGTLPLIFSHI